MCLLRGLVCGPKSPRTGSTAPACKYVWIRRSADGRVSAPAPVFADQANRGRPCRILVSSPPWRRLSKRCGSHSGKRRAIRRNLPYIFLKGPERSTTKEPWLRSATGKWRRQRRFRCPQNPNVSDRSVIAGRPALVICCDCTRRGLPGSQVQRRLSQLQISSRSVALERSGK